MSLFSGTDSHPSRFHGCARNSLFHALNNDEITGCEAVGYKPATPDQTRSLELAMLHFVPAIAHKHNGQAGLVATSARIGDDKRRCVERRLGKAGERAGRERWLET